MQGHGVDDKIVGALFQLQHFVIRHDRGEIGPDFGMAADHHGRRKRSVNLAESLLHIGKRQPVQEHGIGVVGAEQRALALAQKGGAVGQLRLGHRAKMWGRGWDCKPHCR